MGPRWLTRQLCCGWLCFVDAREEGCLEQNGTFWNSNTLYYTWSKPKGQSSKDPRCRGRDFICPAHTHGPAEAFFAWFLASFRVERVVVAWYGHKSNNKAKQIPLSPQTKYKLWFPSWLNTSSLMPSTRLCTTWFATKVSDLQSSSLMSQQWVPKNYTSLDRKSVV